MTLLRTIGACLIAVAFSLPAVAQTSQTDAQEPALPYSPSLNLSSMDKSIDPCANFYQYACGGWQKQNPIPPEQSSWSVYGKLYEDNLHFLRGILEQAAENKETDDATTKLIGNFYSACIDEVGVERRGLKTLQPQLDKVSQLKSVHDLAALLATLHLHTAGRRSILFEAGSDAKFGQFGTTNRAGGSRRSRPARSRLLHQGRRQIQGNARALRSACAENLFAAGRKPCCR